MTVCSPEGCGSTLAADLGEAAGAVEGQRRLVGRLEVDLEGEQRPPAAWTRARRRPAWPGRVGGSPRGSRPGRGRRSRRSAAENQAKFSPSYDEPGGEGEHEAGEGAVDVDDRRRCRPSRAAARRRGSSSGASSSTLLLVEGEHLGVVGLGDRAQELHRQPHRSGSAVQEPARPWRCSLSSHSSRRASRSLREGPGADDPRRGRGTAAARSGPTYVEPGRSAVAAIRVGQRAELGRLPDRREDRLQDARGPAHLPLGVAVVAAGAHQPGGRVAGVRGQPRHRARPARAPAGRARGRTSGRPAWTAK